MLKYKLNNFELLPEQLNSDNQKGTIKGDCFNPEHKSFHLDIGN